MIYRNIETDTLDETFIRFESELGVILDSLESNELSLTADATYFHINCIIETVRDRTGSKPSAAHIRNFVALLSDLSNPTVASAVNHLLAAIALVPPSSIGDQEE